jgi:hypothetical protein
MSRQNGYRGAPLVVAKVGDGVTRDVEGPRLGEGIALVVAMNKSLSVPARWSAVRHGVPQEAVETAQIRCSRLTMCSSRMRMNTSFPFQKIVQPSSFSTLEARTSLS